MLISKRDLLPFDQLKNPIFVHIPCSLFAIAGLNNPIQSSLEERSRVLPDLPALVVFGKYPRPQLHFPQDTPRLIKPIPSGEYIRVFSLPQTEAQFDGESHLETPVFCCCRLCRYSIKHLQTA